MVNELAFVIVENPDKRTFTYDEIKSKTELKVNKFSDLQASSLDQLRKDPRAVFVPKCSIEQAESWYNKLLLSKMNSVSQIEELLKLSNYDELRKNNLCDKNKTDLELRSGYLHSLRQFKEFIEIHLKSIESYMKWVDYYVLNEEKTHYGKYENPFRQFDFYSIGGRFENFLVLKNNTCVNYAQKKDIREDILNPKEIPFYWAIIIDGLFLRQLDLDLFQKYINKINPFDYIIIITYHN